MVGLLPGRPQRGKGGYRNLERLAQDFENEFRKHCVDIDQGRPTEEKRLQSWLVADAYTHERRMAALATSTGTELVFATDEIPLPTATGRIVCDILAARPIENGVYAPVVVELKSERAMKRLVEQVTTYAELVDEHLALFAELYGALLGSKVELRGACEKWIVWPAIGDQEPRTEELGKLGIRLVGYREVEGGFELMR